MPSVAREEWIGHGGIVDDVAIGFADAVVAAMELRRGFICIEDPDAGWKEGVDALAQAIAWRLGRGFNAREIAAFGPPSWDESGRQLFDVLARVCPAPKRR